MVQTALLYDNFCKTGNYVIDDVIIWVQDGNCKKWLKRILVLVHSTIQPKIIIINNNNTNICNAHSVSKHTESEAQDNPIKTVGRDSFLSPKTPKNTSF